MGSHTRTCRSSSPPGVSIARTEKTKPPMQVNSSPPLHSGTRRTHEHVHVHERVVSRRRTHERVGCQRRRDVRSQHE
eukprot:6075468-Prymnesium_polylepis.1